MKRKHLYIAGAAIAGVLLLWWWRRPSAPAVVPTVSLGPTFAVNGGIYKTPPELLTPETLGPGNLVIN